MKKTIFYALVMILSLGATTTFAAKSDLKSNSENTSAVAKTETKLTEAELSTMNKRVEEIRDMDKTNMTVTEKRELKKEMKATKENIKRNGGGYVYIGGGTLLLVLILILLL